MARTKQTARKDVKGPKALPRKKPVAKKPVVKVTVVEKVDTSSGDEDVLVITENLTKMKLPELHKILEEYNIDKSDIVGTGASGRVLKSDIILAITDAKAKDHDGKPMKLPKGKKSPPKKAKTPSPPKKKTSPPKKKVLTIVSLPKGAQIPSVDKLTALQTLEALKTYKQFQGLSDYEIKKKLGTGSAQAKVSELRQALRTLMDNPKSPVVPKKKVPPPKKAVPKKKVSPPKKAVPKKKSPSPKKKTLKCADKKYDPSEEYCNTETGKVGKLTKKKRPFGEEKLKSSIGNLYTYDEEYGFVGTEEDVEAHIEHMKMIEKSKDKKAPTKKAAVKKSPPKKTVVVKKSPPKKAVVKKSPPKKKAAKKTPSPVKPPKTPSPAKPPKTPVKPAKKLPPKTPVKPAKKLPQKPVKKTPQKPAKKLPQKPTKVKRACAAADMTDLQEYDECTIGEVCNVLTGKCIKDTNENRQGLSSLVIDGRDIIGDRETIEKLHKHLGGEMTIYKEPTPVKTPRKTPVKTPVEEPPKRTQKSTKAQKKKEEVVKPTTPEKKKSDGTAVTASREDIYRTFTECLASLK